MVETTGNAPVSTPQLHMQVEDPVYCLFKFVLEARKADSCEYPKKTQYALVFLLQAVLRGQRILIIARSVFSVAQRCVRTHRYIYTGQHVYTLHVYTKTHVP